MRHPRKVEKQNKGFSLVEVLVTLAVISILSIPIINLFVGSAKTNKTAKKIQNASDVAQCVSEYFDAASLDAIKKNYQGKYKQVGDKIVFLNIGDGESVKDGVSYYKGADNEKFYVSVVLDSGSYSVEDGEGISGVNNYYKPTINNLNENSSVTVRGKLDQHDSDIVRIFKEQKGVDVTDKSKIVKHSKFRIVETESTMYKGKIEYRYYLDITYKYYNISVEYKDIELGIGTIDKAGIKAPNLYIVYTPTFAMYGTDPKCHDTIEIEYRTDAMIPADWEKPLDIYIVLQDAYYGQSTENKISLEKNNIKVTCYKGPNEISSSGSFDNSKVDAINLYTNLVDWDKEANLTSGGDKMTKLYKADIYVWKDEKEGITFDEEGNMNIKDGYTTAVSKVKEG